MFPLFYSRNYQQICQNIIVELLGDMFPLFYSRNYQQICQNIIVELLGDMFRLFYNRNMSPSSSTIRGLLEKYPTFGREKETGLLGALDT